MRGTEWGRLLALTALWSGSFLFAKVALAEVGPLTVVLARVGIAAVALNALLIGQGRRLPASPTTWRAFVVMGALNNVLPQCLIAWGMLRIDSGVASILNATTPLFSVLLAHVAGRERATGSAVTGVLIGLAGVATLVGPILGAPAGGGVIGEVAVLGAAMSYACAGLYGRRLLALRPVEASAGMLTAATVVMLPIAAVVERPWTFVPGLRTTAALLALALISTAAGYVLYFVILASAGPTNLLLVTLLMPVGGIALGAGVLGERVTVEAVGGTALIAAGLAVVDGRAWRRIRAATAGRNEVSRQHFRSAGPRR